MKKILLGDELLVIFARIEALSLAIEISKVVSIIEPKNVRKVPLAPVYMNSLLNYQGKIVTVFDMKSFYSQQESAPAKNKRVIYLSHHDLNIGLLTDEIIGLDYVSPSCLEKDLSRFGDGSHSDFIQGIFVVDEDAPGIGWLDEKKIETFVREITLS